MSKELKLSRIAAEVAFSGIMMWASGQVAFELPGISVPITLQSMVAMILPMLLTGRNASGGILLWLVLGLLDVPVFANGSSGLSILYSNSGGYLVGFYLVSFFIRALKDRIMAKGIIWLAVIFVSGHVLLTIIGLSWIKVGGYSIISLETHVIPYLPGLFIKSLLGVIIFWSVCRWLPKIQQS